MDKQKAVRKSVGQESAFVDMLNQEMKELQEGLKQKQIEEMAKIILEASCKGSECANCEFVKRVEEAKITCLCLKSLYNAGYRKIPENDAVVLTEKEYQRYERIEKIIKLAKMEKAIGYEVKNGKLYYFTNMLEGFEYEFKDLQEICDTANHYNEEFFGLQQRLDFWKGKAEETRKETAEKFAEEVEMWKRKAIFYYNLAKDSGIYCIVDGEIAKEFTEGNV